MYPGLCDADCQVAAFRYQQMLVEGQHQQIVRGLRAELAETRSLSTTFQQRLGTFLVHAGQRLQGLNTVTTQRLETVATGERTAIA